MTWILGWALVAMGAAGPPPPPRSSGLGGDEAAAHGLAFTLRNGSTAAKHQVETMAGGVAVLDYDQDGYPDLFFTNGASLPTLTKTDASYGNRLYHNRGDGTFEDVTARAGLAGVGFAIGAAVGDYDNDGYPDLFVAGVNRNFLFHNRGDGTFEDVTAAAGLAQPDGARWAVGGGWFDYDRDGRLDLFVVDYVVWDPASEPDCEAPAGGGRTYCHPRFYQGTANRLYHNEGAGKFRDVSVTSGIAAHVGKGMAVAFADLDGDGWPDVVVTNDTEPNWLFHNRGDGTFTEIGEPAGVAYNDDGLALSSMGVDARDILNHGRPDIFMTALTNESFPLYRNLGRGMFEDVTNGSGLRPLTVAFSGWSTGAMDFDNAGHKDLFVAAGDVQDNTAHYSDRHSRQQCLWLRQTVTGKFEAMPLGPRGQFRGAAFADFNRDGALDVVVTRLNQPAVLFMGHPPPGNHWLQLKLVGTSSNRDAIGAELHLTAPGGEQWNQVTTAVGYASSSDVEVHFGLGRDHEATRLDIRWPSGIRQRLEHIKADQRLVVREPWPAHAASPHRLAPEPRPVSAP